MEIDKIKDDSKIVREKNIDRRGPRQIETDWHIPDPPTFWLPTTFKQAVRQVVFTDVLIVCPLGVDIQSFAPIGLHKTDAASDWLLIKRHCIGMKGLPGVQLQN